MPVLSPRLLAVQEIIAHLGCRRIADIGADHAYTLIHACAAGLTERAFACDVSEGSLRKAAVNIREHGMEDKIETRLGDGLAKISPGEADLIVITGMGGKLIQDILQKGRPAVRAARYAVLQPQRDLPGLRKALQAMDLTMIDERMVREKNQFYNILLCQNGKSQPYTDAEYCFGKILIERKDPVLRAFILKTLRVHEQIVQTIESAQSIAASGRLSALKRNIQMTKEVLQCL
ncbi:MAG: class I SAM-dependent methyltransferase [Clostridiales bacterium]|nr:class I SAM-dependent methyltransferase [Clostridiales bacterium]